MFGISCAPELFQKVMESVVAGLDGVVVYLDDIMVWGRNSEEHNRRLNALLARLQDYGILLNEEKCVFGVCQLEFLGHEMSSSGIRPTESRVAAIKSFRLPRNISELRSFLGLITYVGRFIPSLADKTEPLRNLLRIGEKFDWKAEHTKAFNEIKCAVSETNCLGYYDPHDLCIVIADASPSGLGAVLLQQDAEGKRRIIAFASKSLTEIERKYFQTEREALSLVWAVDRFQLYLLGKKFKLITDCKPLKFLFKERSKPSARIERWVLRLQTYNFDVIYEPGMTNLADALSRLSVTNPVAYRSSDEGCIFHLALTGFPNAVSVEEVEEETKEDVALQGVQQSLETGVWTEMSKEFKAFSSELCFIRNLLLRGDRLVIPEQLRPRMLEIAHESHPGMVVMKRRLRQKVWWPQMDKQVEDFVKKCKNCTLVATPNPPEPLSRTTLPEKAWTDLAIDFVGPLPSGHNLLVIVDYFSRFTEVIIMKQITAQLTVKALHETFCRFGMPESIKTDNGPQFISSDLQAFCKQFGIQHRRTTPYWPQANGEVERINRSIGKRLKISNETAGADWQWDLRTFVLMHNSTPHSTTGVAPSILMFGRQLKDKLPGLLMKGSNILEEIRDRDHVRKMRGAEYTDNRRGAKANDISEGDIVVSKRIQKENKLSTTFDPEEYSVVERNGSDITLKSKETGKIIHRNVAHLKKLISDKEGSGTAEEETEGEEVVEESMRSGPQHAPGEEQETAKAEENQGKQSVTSTRDGIRCRPKRRVQQPSYLKDFNIDNVN